MALLAFFLFVGLTMILVSTRLSVLMDRSVLEQPISGKGVALASLLTKFGILVALATSIYSFWIIEWWMCLVAIFAAYFGGGILLNRDFVSGYPTLFAIVAAPIGSLFLWLVILAGLFYPEKFGL